MGSGVKALVMNFSFFFMKNKEKLKRVEKRSKEAKRKAMKEQQQQQGQQNLCVWQKESLFYYHQCSLYLLLLLNFKKTHTQLFLSPSVLLLDDFTIVSIFIATRDKLITKWERSFLVYWKWNLIKLIHTFINHWNEGYKSE